MRHGVRSTYVNHGCRCTKCLDVHAAYQLAYRERNARTPLGEGDPRHGTDNAYANFGCRCPECTRAHREALAETRRRKRLARALAEVGP